MKNSYLNIVVVIFILLLSHSAAFAKDNSESGAKETEHIIVDHEGFNKSILSAKGEAWTLDPVMVSLRFTGTFEGLTQSIERKNRSAEYPETTTVIITNEGLLDDSVMGEKYLLELKRTEHGAWLVNFAGKVIKCRQGRGHHDYSKKPCN